MEGAPLPSLIFDLLQSKIKARNSREAFVQFDVRDRLGEFHPARVLEHKDNTYREFLVTYRFFRSSDNEVVTLDRLLPLSTSSWRKKKGASDRTLNEGSHGTWMKIMGLLRREDPLLYSQCLAVYQENVAEHPYFGSLKMPPPGLAIVSRKSNRLAKTQEKLLIAAYRAHGWHDGFNFGIDADIYRNLLDSDDKEHLSSDAPSDEVMTKSEGETDVSSDSIAKARRKRRKKEKQQLNGPVEESAYESFPPRLFRGPPMYSSELNNGTSPLEETPEGSAGLDGQEHRARALEWLRYRRELAISGLEEWRRRRCREGSPTKRRRPTLALASGRVAERRELRPSSADRRRRCDPRMTNGVGDDELQRSGKSRALDAEEKDPGINVPNDAWDRFFSILRENGEDRNSDATLAESNGLANGAAGPRENGAHAQQKGKGGEAPTLERRTRFGGISPASRPRLNVKDPGATASLLASQKSGRSPSSATRKGSPSGTVQPASLSVFGKYNFNAKGDSATTVPRKRDSRGKIVGIGEQGAAPPSRAVSRKLLAKHAATVPQASNGGTLGKAGGPNSPLSRMLGPKTVKAQFDKLREAFVPPRATRFRGVIQRKRTLDAGGRNGWLARWETKVDGNPRFVKLGSFSTEADAARAVDREALRRTPIALEDANAETTSDILIINFTLDNYLDDSIIRSASLALAQSTATVLGRSRRIFGRHLRLKNSKERCPECGESTGVSTSGVVLICDGEDCGQETHLECTEHCVAPAGDFFCSLCRKEIRKQQALARVLYRSPTPRPKLNDSFPVSPVARQEQNLPDKVGASKVSRVLPPKSVSPVSRPGLLPSLSTKQPAQPPNSGVLNPNEEDGQPKQGLKEANATSKSLNYESAGGLVVMRKTPTGRSLRICSMCKSPATFLHQAFSAALGGMGPDAAILLCEGCAADAHNKKSAGRETRPAKKILAVQGGA